MVGLDVPSTGPFSVSLHGVKRLVPLLVVALVFSTGSASGQPDTQVPSTADAEAFLSALSDPNSPDARRLLAQTWAVLPNAVRRRIGNDLNAVDQAGRARVVAWWRAQDSLPATVENEDVVEHLRRVRVAERRYPAGNVRGFDDRGAVLVLLGDPLSARRLRSRTLEIAATLDAPPDNELWEYGPSGPAYLFVDDATEGWKQGSPLELIPRWMRRSDEVLAALQDFLPPIAAADPSYATLMSTVDRLSSPVETVARYGDEDSPGYEDRLAWAIGHETRTEARRAARRRDEDVTRQGPDLPSAAEIPLAVRTARFRALNGGTRIEVAFAPEPGAYVGLRGRHVVRAAVRLSEPFPLQPQALEPVLSARPLPATAARPGGTSPVQSATLLARGAEASVAVQVDVVDPTGDVVRRAVRRAGPLSALAADVDGLVVSDPLPHLTPQNAATALSGLDREEAATVRNQWRYPYDVVVPGARVGVYVEAYDLGTVSGQSRYEVERGVDVVRDGERQFVSLSATESGTSFTTAREFIVIRTPDDVRPGDVVEFYGTIRDLITGRSGTWRLAFGVVAP